MTIGIPFNRPDLAKRELDYVRQCLEGRAIAGDNDFTRRCHELLTATYGTTVLLMHSCTAALEAAAILAEIGPGDEVVMPSFTFVSTANAVVLRGAIPVFVDIRPDTLNIDESLIEAALTPRTRAIMPIHYAGVGAAMERIMEIAATRGLRVIEDAAQCYGALYDGRPLGTFGDMGCISFHETKNIVSGEGGALIVNDPALIERAHYIREKGTNRTRYLRGEIDKYEWIDIGSSFLPSDLLAAVLLAQLERSSAIVAHRRAIWDRYHAAFQSLEEEGLVTRPAPVRQAAHNGHIYYLLGRDRELSSALRQRMKADGIGVTSHYVPLHSSPAGRRFGRASGTLAVTDEVAETIVRLPMFSGLTDEAVDRVADRVFVHARAIAALPAARRFRR